MATCKEMKERLKEIEIKIPRGKETAEERLIRNTICTEALMARVAMSNTVLSRVCVADYGSIYFYFSNSFPIACIIYERQQQATYITLKTQATPSELNNWRILMEDIKDILNYKGV